MDESTASAASCIASPRMLTKRNAFSNDNPPAKQTAVYSPNDKPATAPTLVSRDGSVARKTSAAAIPTVKRAGWAYRVWSSFSAGPSAHNSVKSYPSTSLAVAKISRPAGCSRVAAPMPGV